MRERRWDRGKRLTGALEQEEVRRAAVAGGGPKAVNGLMSVMGKGRNRGSSRVKQTVCKGGGRAQGSESAVVRAQGNEAVTIETHDTEDATLSLCVTHGDVGEAYIARGNAIAREYTTDC